jgi:hypothetical protein
VTTGTLGPHSAVPHWDSEAAAPLLFLLALLNECFGSTGRTGGGRRADQVVRRTIGEGPPVGRWGPTRRGPPLVHSAMPTCDTRLARSAAKRTGHRPASRVPPPVSCDRAHIPLRRVHARSASRHSLTEAFNAGAAAVLRALDGNVPPSSSPQRADRTRTGSYSTRAPSFTKGMIRFPRRSFRKKCTDKLSKFAASNSSTSSFRPSTTRTPVRQPRVAFRLDHSGVGPTEPFRRLSAFLSRIVEASLSTAEWRCKSEKVAADPSMKSATCCQAARSCCSLLWI